jgi:hypothetical protein
MNREAATTALIIGAALILLTCALALLVALFTPNTTAQQIAAIHERNPAFNLEDTTPNADAAALEATQEALLNGYGWVDRDREIARIPIERAMQIIIAEQPEPTPESQG